MREQESLLQQFADDVLKARLITPTAAPHCVRWVRQFLARPASDESVADRIRLFCEHLERRGCQDWQVRQAEQALHLYFVNFLKTDRSGWQERPAGGSVTESRAL